MKQQLVIAIAGLTIVFAACTKSKLDVESPTIHISLDPARLVNDTFVYALGDTTKFIMEGYAGNLSFYPGISGYDYDNRKTTLLTAAHPVMSFASRLQWGVQQNTLQILATDKLASLDSTTVVSADWTDITKRAILATNATSVPSGDIDLSDIVNGPTDSLFIAFKYHGLGGSTQRTWTITNYAVNNVVTQGIFNLSSLSTDVAYWTKYGNVQSPANAMWIASSTQLQIVGGGSPDNIAWIISRPLYVGRVASSVSIAVKNINDPAVTSYDYVYSAPGTYKAVWVAFNNTIKDQKSTIKEFYIKIVAP